MHQAIARTDNHPGSIESTATAIGRELLASAARQRGSAVPGGPVMTRLMADERLRVQALRFVDVLPALEENDTGLVRHLREYFTHQPKVLAGLPLIGRRPALLNTLLRHSESGPLAHAISALVRGAAGMMAHSFIAGHDADSILPAIRKLARRGMGFTLDLLGEATLSEQEAESYQARCLDLIRRLSPHVRGLAVQRPWLNGDRPAAPVLNVSVKITALCSQFRALHPAHTAAVVRDRLRPIMLEARKHGALINLDMEQYDTKQITLRVFRELLMEPELRDWPDVGIAMQAYLRETEDDLEALIRWAADRPAPIMVRLVRGAYWDYETVIAQQRGWPIPVWTRKADTDRSYERCLWKLLNAHPHIEAAVATHNVRSLALAVAMARSLKLEHSRFEFQMLYGMAEKLKRAMVSQGHPLRIYVPFGELLPGMAYLVRRLLENTSSQSFLRMGFAQGMDPDTLLAPPGDVGIEDRSNQPQRAEGSAPAPALENTTEPNMATTSQTRAIDSLAELPEYQPEPVRRFTDPRERGNLHEAIDKVRSAGAWTCRPLIDGRAITTDRLDRSTNPAAPDQVIARVHLAGAGEMKRAIEVGERAFESWRRVPASERAACMIRAAEAIRQRRDELTARIILEAGKPWADADGDVCEAIDFLEYYARQAVVLDRGLWLNVPGETNRYHYQPRGIGAVITPWNFPLAIVTGMIAAPLVTGNAVILKPAPQTPAIAGKLVELLISKEVGLPPGVIGFLPGDDELGAALVEHPRIRFVSFTGSRKVGCWINHSGAKVAEGQHHIRRIVAEMGGKNSIIVDDDADPDDAVRGVVDSAFGYAGQKCSACSRVIVVGGQIRAFGRRVVEAARSLRIGDPADPANIVPPVIDSEAQQRIGQAIERGREQATCLLESRAPTPGHYVGPTVFADVDPDSPLAQEEIFGPVLAIIAAPDFETALRIANNTPYALTGGIYSRSPIHCSMARERFEVGNLYINRPITGSIVGRQPFGGFKLSGVGAKAGGPDYLHQFVEARTITEETLRRGFAPDESLAIDLSE
ncbi:MAG: proline dehydrogenase family protein [Phycisphaeraceae bacterium]|nr:proline dehydrogenase family protein [Phycisphaeraceae bacterium]